VIIGVVLPQFVDRTSGHLPPQMLELGLIAVTIGLLSDSLWAVIASQLRSWFLTADAYNRTRVQPAHCEALASVRIWQPRCGDHEAPADGQGGAYPGLLAHPPVT
jgi:hypothetical protein